MPGSAQSSPRASPRASSRAKKASPRPETTSLDLDAFLHVSGGVPATSSTAELREQHLPQLLPTGASSEADNTLAFDRTRPPQTPSPRRRAVELASRSRPSPAQPTPSETERAEYLRAAQRVELERLLREAMEQTVAAMPRNPRRFLAANVANLAGVRVRPAFSDAAVGPSRQDGPELAAMDAPISLPRVQTKRGAHESWPALFSAVDDLVRDALNKTLEEAPHIADEPKARRMRLVAHMLAASGLTVAAVFDTALGEEKPRDTSDAIIQTSFEQDFFSRRGKARGWRTWVALRTTSSSLCGRRRDPLAFHRIGRRWARHSHREGHPRSRSHQSRPRRNGSSKRRWSQRSSKR